MRSKSLDNIAVAYYVKSGNGQRKGEEAVPALQQRTEDSWLEMILPFSDQPDLRESMVSIFMEFLWMPLVLLSLHLLIYFKFL
jgi:hypothetical protein